MVKTSPVVMVVDDELHMCTVLRRILTQEGYKVTTIPDGETALRLVEKTKPDVILLDLLMPGIDGREVCRRVRQFLPKTQIIYFTAKVESMNPLKSKELRDEADALIAKPATRKQILSKVSRVLQGARQ